MSILRDMLLMANSCLLMNMDKYSLAKYPMDFTQKQSVVHFPKLNHKHYISWYGILFQSKNFGQDLVRKNIEIGLQNYSKSLTGYPISLNVVFHLFRAK